MRPESGLWVVHLLEPKAIIQCSEGHIKVNNPFRHYQFKNSDGATEQWTLSAYHFFTTDFLTEPEQQVVPLLDRAWRWFRSYLQFEDKNIDDAKDAEEN